MHVNKKQKHDDMADVRKSLSVVSTTSDISMVELNSWLLTNQVAGLGRVDFKYSQIEGGGSLGCFAKEQIFVGDTIFVIPQRVIIGYKNASNTLLSNFIRKAVTKYSLTYAITSELLIWLFMIEQRALKEGFFEVYLNSLDTSSPSPVNWNSELLSSLEGTNLGVSISDSLNSLTIHMELIEKLRILEPVQSMILLPTYIFNLDALIWAKGHYLARRYPGEFSSTCAVHAIEKREPGLENLGSLVPLLDILNHNDEQDWLKLEVYNECLYVKCNYPIEKGAELFSNYGLLSNEKLIFAYGFALQQNEYDAIAVRLKAGHTDNAPSSSSAATEIKSLGVFYIESGGVHGVPSALWSTLSQLGGSAGSESSESNNDDDAEDLQAPEIEVGIEECMILRDFLVNKLNQFNQVMERSSAILLKHGVVPTIEDKTIKDQTTNMNSMVTTTADIRATYIQWYLEGQHRIIVETIDAMNELIEQSEESIDGDDDDDDEEEAESESHSNNT